MVEPLVVSGKGRQVLVEDGFFAQQGAIDVIYHRECLYVGTSSHIFTI